MNANQNRPAQSQNEPKEVITFNFSESKSPIRNIFVNGEPLFVGKDIADALGYNQSRKAINRHCKHGTKRTVLTNGGKQLMLVIPESDVYRLIIGSKLPSAQKFEKWLMEEVLPSLRKKGFYKMGNTQNDYQDARDIPHFSVLINEKKVTCIELDNTKWFSINDYHNSIGSRTSGSQTAKRLNLRQQLAKKIWLFGATNPSWFTTEFGLKLIASGSRIFSANQLKLDI